jgi:uridine kinase
MNQNNNLRLVLPGGRTLEVPHGTTLLDVVHSLSEEAQPRILAARFNNALVDLRAPLEEDGLVQWVDLTSAEGTRVHQRSLIFVLAVAVGELFPDAQVTVEHAVGKGLYGRIERDPAITAEEIARIKERMAEIIRADEPILWRRMEKDEAVRMFITQQLWGHVRLLKAYGGPTFDLYELRGRIEHFDGPLVPSTRYLRLFDLCMYDSGYLLRFPRREWPDKLPPLTSSPKLFEVFRENERWLQILDVKYVGNVNDIIAAGEFTEFVMICEALHSKKLNQITQQILNDPRHPRVLLISGPSSSGKTTVSKRLYIDLRVEGKRPATISLDNYFVDREKTPKDADGHYDYESIEAIDIDLFNMHILTLLEGRPVEVPRYDFTTGRRRRTGNRVQISKDDFVLVEGIHALNDRLTPAIPAELKFKIYVSALTQLNINELNRIRTTDTRLLRRLIRDARYRGYSAAETLARWPLVRKGEEKWIFPFQEQADVMFNSALVYEHAVVKRFAEPLLEQIGPEEPVFAEAQRLLHFLKFFHPASAEGIPPFSILREFLGDSSFNY